MCVCVVVNVCVNTGEQGTEHSQPYPHDTLSLPLPEMTVTALLSPALPLIHAHIGLRTYTPEGKKPKKQQNASAYNLRKHDYEGVNVQKQRCLKYADTFSV